MLFDTSVKNNEVTRQINELVGIPFSLLDIIKFGTIGSSRMEIVSYSNSFDDIMKWDMQAVFANLCIRPNGLIVIINVRLNNFSWVIPYRYLSIFKAGNLTVHGNGSFLTFKIQNDQNKKFIDKVLYQKSQFLNTDYHGDDFR